MGANSKIEWCDSTFNPWRGCAKVSITSDGNWKQPLRWNRKVAEQPFVCRKCGTPYFCESGGSPRCDWKCEIVPYRPRVFCGSLCDWLEDRPELDAPLARLLLTIHATPNLQWLLLTKRPELFAARMVAALHADEQAGALAVQWAHGSPMPQAAVGASVENQAAADARIPHLLRIPAGLRFLSCEPLLGPINLGPWLAAPEPEGKTILRRFYGPQGFDPKGDPARIVAKNEQARAKERFDRKLAERAKLKGGLGR